MWSILARQLIVPALLIGSNASAQSPRILLVPGEYVYLNEINGPRGVYDAVIQNVAIVNHGQDVAAIDGVWIDAFKAERVIQRTWIGVDRFVRDTTRARAWMADGMEDQMRSQLVDEGGLAHFLGQDTSLTPVRDLGPASALLAQGIHLSFSDAPDRIEVSLEGRNGDQSASDSTASVAVVSYKPSIPYIFPLRGTWFMRSIPSATSHHRWHTPTEFALDFFKVDARGSLRSGSSEDVESYYGYGEPVMAAAAGTVVEVEKEAIQNRQEPEEHLRQELARGFRRAIAGNYVLIRHENGEHSSYGHLEAGSVRVDVGERVAQGQVIGEVGDTGDSIAVHLHFQLNAGDPFLSRGIPIHFSNLMPSSPETGKHITPRQAR